VNLAEWDIHGMGRVLMAATSRVAQVTAHGQKAAVSICKTVGSAYPGSWRQDERRLSRLEASHEGAQPFTSSSLVIGAYLPRIAWVHGDCFCIR
jgi:hypothetical protein